jgi:hypothetical protein
MEGRKARVEARAEILRKREIIRLMRPLKGLRVG